MSDCLFCKIVAGEIPAQKLYEDDEMLAFWDIAPQTPKHFLVIPKKHLAGVSDMSADDALLVGKMIHQASLLAKEHGIGEHFRLVTNNGAEAGQVIFHLHIHVLGGKKLHTTLG